MLRRPERVAEQLREGVIQIVGYELDDPRVASITVTDVRVSKDLRDARVYVMVEGTEQEAKQAMTALHRAEPYVRRQVGLFLDLRYTPHIHFVRDRVEERATRIDTLLLGNITHDSKQEVTPIDDVANKG